MYIRKFFLVSYIVSFILGVCLLYRDKLFILIGIDNKNLLIEKLFYDDNGVNSDILLDIYIPRINLYQIVYTIDSSLNNVDYHVQILENSNLDDNLLFLAAHSGGGSASYFDNLIYLEKGDFVWVSIDKTKYVFVVEEKFYIQKNGYFEVSYDSEGNTLFLLTCSLNYIDKQLVVKAKLIYKC